MQRGVGLIPRYHVKENCMAILQESQWYVYHLKPYKKGKRTSEIIVGCTCKIFVAKAGRIPKIVGKHTALLTTTTMVNDNMEVLTLVACGVRIVLHCPFPSMIFNWKQTQQQIMMAKEHDDNDNNNVGRIM